MKIYKIEPSGFCFGVKNAIKKITDLRNNTFDNTPIYSLGKLIHNDYEINRLTSEGIITLEENNVPRDILLDKINDGIVVFTAHGVSDKVYKKIKEKQLPYLDCTCPKVLKVHNIIKSYLSKGYKIIYIGKKNHPETEGILGINPNIYLVEKIDDLNSINHSTSDKIFATNQTTLNIELCKNVYQKLQEKFPFIEINNSICTSTFERQNALKDYLFLDILLVIGDKKSSNTISLFEYAKKLNIKTYHISNKDELIKLEKANSFLKNIKTIGITSGASTPDNLIDEIIQYLNSV